MPQEAKFLDLMAAKHIWAFGGMRTLPEPHLLAANEAEEAKDCDVSSGSLKPAKKLLHTEDVAGNWTFTRQKDRTGSEEWPCEDYNISYEHWNDNLVYSWDNVGTNRPAIIYNEDGNPNYKLGITPPDVVGNGTAGEAQARDIFLFAWFRGDVLLGAGNYTAQANDSIPDDVPLILSADESGYEPATNDVFVVQVASDCNTLLFAITTAASGGSYSFVWEYEKNDGSWETVGAVSDGTTNLTVAGNGILSWTLPASRNIIDGKVRYRARLTIASNPTVFPKAGRIFQLPSGYTGNPTSEYSFKGTYKYKVTYVNETRGVESAPQSPNRTDAAIVVDVTDMPTESIVISGLTNPPVLDGATFYSVAGELPVEKIYLYRTTGDGEIYYKLTDTAPAGSGGGPIVGAEGWEDTTPDIDLVLNKEMDAELNYLPGYLDDGGGTFILGGVAAGTNVKGITFHDGRFFCVGGGAAASYKDLSVIFWSRPDNPHAWPLQQFLKLPATIQGLFSTPMGLMAFTERGPYLLYPGEWDATTFTKKYIPTAVPGNWDCRSIQTCRTTPYGVMWASRNAIVVWDGAGEPKDLTTQDLGDVPLDTASYLSAEFYKKQYLLFSDIGTLILDFRRDGTPKARLYGWDGTGSVGTGYAFKCSYYDPEEDKVYVLTADGSNGDIWEWEGATGTRSQTHMSLDYTTGEYGGETVERLKVFDRVEIGFDGTDADGTAYLIVDGSTVASGTLSGSGAQRDVVFFPVAQTGHKCQVRLTGRATAIHDAVLYYYPDSLFSQDTIFHYIQVTTTGTTAITVHVDGVDKTLSGGPATTTPGMHHVFFGTSPAMNIRGRNVQVRWTNAAVTDVRLFFSEEEEFYQQRIWHGAKVTVADATSCQVKLYMDGTLKTTSSAFTAAGEYDVFFPANTRGVLPQWSATSSNVTSVVWVSDEEKTFSERRIWHGAKVTTSGDDTVSLWIDGVDRTVGSGTVTGAKEHHVFCDADTTGVLAQVISTGSNITRVEWWSEPDGSYKDRMVITGVKCMVNAACTVYVYVDGSLETTYTASLYRTGEHTIFCPSNTHGRLYQLQWTANGVDDESIEWTVEPDGTFGERLLVKGIQVAWDGDLTYDLRVDGVSKDTGTLAGTVETHDSEHIELLPPAIGYVPQFIVADFSSVDAGYLHKAEWNVEKEPPKESSVNDIAGTQRGYLYRAIVTYWGSVTFKAYLDDVLRSEISTSLTTYDTTDWQTVILEADPTSGLAIVSKLAWDNEGTGFVKQVIWDVAPDRRREETIPPPGTPGRYYLKGFWVTYIGAGTLNIYARGSVTPISTKSLSSVTVKTRTHYYLPAGQFGDVFMYDYSETSKNSLFVFNIEWIGVPVQ